MGGTSLLTQRLANQLEKSLDFNVSATTIYQYPTIAKLCEFVENTKAAKPLVSHSNIKRELKWSYCQ
jgi:hypothetical protein